MDHAARVGVVDRLGDPRHQLGRLAGRQGPFGQPLGQALPLDEAHAEIVLPLVLADLVDRHDARMIEVRRRLGLGVEPLHVGVVGELAGEDHLERHGPVEADLPCAGRRRPCRRGPARGRSRSRRSSGCGPVRGGIGLGSARMIRDRPWPGRGAPRWPPRGRVAGPGWCVGVVGARVGASAIGAVSGRAIVSSAWRSSPSRASSSARSAARPASGTLPR